MQSPQKPQQTDIKKITRTVVSVDRWKFGSMKTTIRSLFHTTLWNHTKGFNRMGRFVPIVVNTHTHIHFKDNPPIDVRASLRVKWPQNNAVGRHNKDSDFGLGTKKTMQARSTRQTSKTRQVRDAGERRWRETQVRETTLVRMARKGKTHKMATNGHFHKDHFELKCDLINKSPQGW